MGGGFRLAGWTGSANECGFQPDVGFFTKGARAVNPVRACSSGSPGPGRRRNWRIANRRSCDSRCHPAYRRRGPVPSTRNTVRNAWRPPFRLAWADPSWNKDQRQAGCQRRTP